ncbi:hypothetical protein BGW41_005655 [Actinomortierella wolfii]|nr:hypothetical protein BGW41_005655 [Actinomortierella wolfii]
MDIQEEIAFCRNLQYKHIIQFYHEVLHRDIKSDNVLLTDNHRVAKLCDFGVSRRDRNPLNPNGTSGDTHVGTRRWMAPELFVENPEYTKKTDVYSLGWVIWQMAKNSIIPFEGIEEAEAIKEIEKGVRGDIPKDTPDKMRKPIKGFWKHKASRRPDASKFVVEDAWTNVFVDDSSEPLELSAIFSCEGTVGQPHVDAAQSPTFGSPNCQFSKHPYSISSVTHTDVLQSTSSYSINQYATATVNSTKRHEDTIHRLGVSQSQLPSKKNIQQRSLTHTELSEFSPLVDQPLLKVRVIDIRRQALVDNMHAQFALGMMFLTSKGDLENNSESLFWFKKAAAHGHPEAQFRIGYMHEHNKETAKDINRAIHWYDKAANQGHKEAKRRLRALFSPQAYSEGVEKSDNSSDSDDSHTSDSDDPKSGSGAVGIPSHQESSGVHASELVPPASTSLVLGALIKEGDIGSVYHARYVNIPCVAKQLRISPQQFQHSAIQDEIALVQRLRHLHLIQFYEVDEHEGHIYFIMELAEKGSLSDVITSDEPLDWPTKIRIANEVVRGIEYLHYKRVLHGFLKSSNVLLTENMRAKLSDFGLPAVRFVRWMAPELLNTNPHYSTKSDMYSLGMVMWEMAANCTTPFREQADDRSVKVAVTRGKREELPQDVPDKYRKWIERCWEHNPEKRPEAHEIDEEANEPPHEIGEESNEPPHEHSITISQYPASVDFDRILEFMQQHKPMPPMARVLSSTCLDLVEHCDLSCSLVRSATANNHGTDEDRRLYDAFKRVAQLLLSVSSEFYVLKHSSSLEVEITAAWSDVTEAAKAILESRAPESTEILLGSTIKKDILSMELQCFKGRMGKVKYSLKKAYKIFDSGVSCLKEDANTFWTTHGGVFIDEASLQETRFGHLGHLVFDWNESEVFAAKRVGEIGGTTREDTLMRVMAISHWMRFCEGIIRVHKIQFPDLIIYGSQIQKIVPLDQYLTEHKLTPCDMWRLAFKISSALSFVHECKVIHRDIRAANVFMVEEEEEGRLVPKLTGFEICRNNQSWSLGPSEQHDVWTALEIRRGHGSSYMTDSRPKSLTTAHHSKQESPPPAPQRYGWP